MMKPINVMVNGLPGNMARNVAEQTHRDERFELIGHSLTGPEIAESKTLIDDASIELIPPAARHRRMEQIKKEYGPFITVDFSHPTAVNDNADFYCRNGLCFVMGTTGGDRDHLLETVAASGVSAVIAPNMAKQIVGFQAMMAYAANAFPQLFRDYTLTVRESHQQGKADTSGTARAMVQYFNELGIPFTAGDIIQERDPKAQRETWGVPEPFIGGHAWHTYTLDSPDRTVRFEFTHNVNGRNVYALGTLDAISYLNEKVLANNTGQVFSMIDVLKGA